MKIDQKKTLRFNGFPMRVHIWGESEKNPIIVFVHGGPGIPFRHRVAEYMLPLTDSYTLVAYDQRGTGGSYRPYMKVKDIGTNAYVDDLISLCGYLLRHFKQEKLYVVAESFGTYITTLAVLKKPSLFAGYIGYGQMVDDQKAMLYQIEEIRECALDEGDEEAIGVLDKIGLPADGKFKTKKAMNDFLYLYYAYLVNPYQPSFEDGVVKPFVESEENSPSEIEGWEKGQKLVGRAFAKEPYPCLLPKEGKLRIETPFHVIQGMDDMICPAVLLPEFMDAVEAPEKSLTFYPHIGHIPCFDSPARFMRDIRKKFR